MSSEPNTSFRLPGRGVRFALWLGIYLAAQVPIYFRYFNGEGQFNPAFIFILPSFLGMFLCIFLNLLPESISHIIAGPVIGVGLIFGYLFYLYTLIALLRARERRRFSFVLLLHVLAVLANQSLLVAITL